MTIISAVEIGRLTRRLPTTYWIFTLLCFLASPLAAKPRARDLGIPFRGATGPLNAITDVSGVEVGQVSILRGKGKKGEMHPARTGVTVVFPTGRKKMTSVPASWDTYNAYGDMTGLLWLQDSGLLSGPVALTNTYSVGVVRDSIIKWVHERFPNLSENDMPLPVVGETDDSWVNDIDSHWVEKSHVYEALDHATGGPVAEGNIGAGTGTVTFRFKSGMGTSSRKIEGGYMVGVLVQSNFGLRTDMEVAGVPVGLELEKVKLPIENPLPKRDGSICVILATNAPLLPHQMKRLVRHVSAGMVRSGGIGRTSSGDLFVGFSTALPQTDAQGIQHWASLANDRLDPVFEGAVWATEEAIINALVAAEDMSGTNGNTYFAVPHDQLIAAMKKYNRLRPGK